MLKVVEYIREVSLPVCKDIGTWNVWDLEHDLHIHDYVKTTVIYEDKECVIMGQKFKMPVIPFLKKNSLIFMKKVDDDTTISTNAIGFGIISKAILTAKEGKDKNSTDFHMHYKVYLPGWTKLLSPLFNILIKKWTDKTWEEDLPLKIRRQKALECGFIDGLGVPKKLENRRFEKAVMSRPPFFRPDDK